MKSKKVRIVTEDGFEVEAMAPIVVSASRATDIPAFYVDWFFNRLQKGYCVWQNPFSGQNSYVSFSNTSFIVFWSKNPRPLIPHLPKLKERGIDCYIHFTLNDYEEEGLEPRVPPLSERIETFINLSKLLGKHAILWRFDPLILTDTLGIEELLHKVSRIAELLKDYTEKLIFSFADIGVYAKVGRNLKANGIKYREWTEPEMIDFASRLSQMNREKGWNLKLATCAEKIDLDDFGIVHNKCIDDELIVRIAWRNKSLMEELGLKILTRNDSLFALDESLESNDVPSEAILLDETHYAMRSKKNRAAGQRRLCGCVESKDIGQYNTCPHGCLYCYANTSPLAASSNHSKSLKLLNSEKILN